MQNLQVEGIAKPVRYNADVARQVLARASEIEQTEQDTLTAAQIETLGRELGLSPEAVRRALGEVGATPIAAQTITAQTNLPLLRQKEIRGIVASSVVLGLMNAVFLYCLLHYISYVTSLQTMGGAVKPFSNLVFFAMLYGLAPLLAYRHGWRTADYRLGVIAGGWGGLCSAVGSFLAIVFAVATHGILQNTFIAGVSPLIQNATGTTGTLMIMVLAAIGCGYLGGVARRWWDGIRRAEER